MKKLITPSVEKRVRQLRKDLQATRDESIRTRVHTDEQHFFNKIAEALNADAVKLGLSGLEVGQRNWYLLDPTPQMEANRENGLRAGYAGTDGHGFGLPCEFHVCQRPAGELKVGDYISAGSFLDEVVSVKLNTKSIRVQTRSGQQTGMYDMNGGLLKLDTNVVRLRRPEEYGEVYYRKAVR